MRFNKYYQATIVAYNMQHIWTYYTKIWSGYWEKIHLMSFLLITNLFLIELIFRQENITLLRRECPKRFKVALISPLYSLTTGRCINKSPHSRKTVNILCKNTIFPKSSPNNIFLVEYSRMNMSTLKEVPKKTSVDEDTERKSKEIAWSLIFWEDFKCPCLS